MSLFLSWVDLWINVPDLLVMSKKLTGFPYNFYVINLSEKRCLLCKTHIISSVVPK